MKFAFACALVLLGSCITTTRLTDVAPSERNFAKAVTKPGAAGMVTLKPDKYAAHLGQMRIEGEQLCGVRLPPANEQPPPAPEQRCYAMADIKEVTLFTTGKDAGATAQTWGVLASCVVLLPLCFAAGATAPGQ